MRRETTAVAVLACATVITGTVGHVPHASADSHRTLWRGGGYVILCEDSILTCGVDEDDLANRFAREDAARMGEIILKIEDWFKKMRFPDRNIRRRGDDFIINYASETFPCSPDAWGCVTSPGIAPAQKNVYLQPEADAITIAHELAHTLVPTKNSSLDWFDEAMAVAVGWAHGSPFPVETWLFPPGHIMDLDLPFHSGSERGYEKGSYMLHLGRLMGSHDSVGHLRGFFTSLATSLPTVRGMHLLYGGPEDVLADYPFDEVFPGFVAKFNHIGEFAPDAPYYYQSVTDWEMEGFAHNLRATSRINREVEAFAADPVLLSALGIAAPGSAPARERLMIAELEIASADRPDDLTLIFEHDVAGRAKRYLLIAGDPDDASQADGAGGDGIPHSGPFIRVANAASTARDTDAQSYELTFTLAPTAIELPECVETGEAVTLQPDGADWSGVGNAEISVSAGRVNGMVFEAPNTEQTVDVTLTVQYPLTRSEVQLAAVDRGAQSVPLGEINITAEDCDSEILGEYTIAIASDRQLETKTRFHDHTRRSTNPERENILWLPQLFRIWNDDGALVGTWERGTSDRHYDLSPALLTRADFRSFYIADELVEARIDLAEEAEKLAGVPFEHLQRFIGRAEPEEDEVRGTIERIIHLVRWDEDSFLGVEIETSGLTPAMKAERGILSLDRVSWQRFTLKAR